MTEGPNTSPSAAGSTPPPNPAAANIAGDIVMGDKNVNLTAGGDIVGRDKITNVITTYHAPSWAAVQHQRNRQTIINAVRETWVTGVLEHTLFGAAFLELGVVPKPEAVEQAWNLRVPEPDLPAPGPGRLDLFDQANGAWLILGAPGAGKTTTLLELARDLLNRADQDSTAPVPIIFSLSAWAEKRTPLAVWLVEELFRRYQVPRPIGSTWVAQDMLIPLLDGLDEVQPEQRAACANAINAFRGDHGLVPLVVTSRLAEYEALAIRLRLRAAVVVQPLTLAQVDAHLARFGDRLAGLRAGIQSQADLQELASTPLMLGVMMVVYQGQSAQITLSGSSAEQRTYLFSQYVERMLAPAGDARVYGLGQPAVTDHPARAPFTRQQTLHWLSWLAQAMQRNGQRLLHLEWMQPQWLASRAQAALVTLGTSLILGLGVGLICGVLSSGFALQVAFGLLAGFAGGLAGRAASHWRDRSRAAEPAGRAAASTGAWQSGAAAVAALVGGGLILADLAARYDDPTGNLGVRVGLSLIVGLVAGFMGYSSNIATVEELHWSRYGLRRGLDGLFIGSAVGALVGVPLGFVIITLTVVPSLAGSDGWAAALIAGLGAGWIGAFTWGLVAWFFGGFIGGHVGWLRGSLSVAQLSDRRASNEGMWRSLRSAFIGLLIGGALAGSIAAVALLPGALQPSEPPEAATTALQVILILSFTFALIGAVAYGGRAVIQHLLLRLLFWRDGFTPVPWHYPRFLDYAAERVLLREVGGGYIFVHPLLMDYLAALPA